VKEDCPACGKSVRVKKDGSLYAHPGCDGDAGIEYNEPSNRPPSFPASFDSECDNCDGAIFAGDEIRSDGSGGWEHARHAEEQTASVPHVHTFVWADDENGHSGSFCACGQEEPDGKASPYLRLLAKEVGDPTPLPYPGSPSSITDPAQHDPTEADAFLDPTTTQPPVPEINVSGQPKARYEWYGKQNRGYLVKLPDTGDFQRYKNGKPKGLVRVTTFVKAASDQNALTDWAKRNVLMGASLRPDIVAKAHGLKHETDRAELMSLVGELETAAGAKVSADIGILIHEFTERLDGDPSFTIESVPAQYRPAVLLYAETLRAAGLRPVPGLIERTTYVPDFGGVVGTLDRVYYHERSGQYLIGDVKTGKTLKYGMDEIEAQEAIYARGVNGNGVYDWNTNTWYPPHSYGDSPEHGPWQVPKVSEDWGVVVHMPVQGDDAGKCLLVRADLQRGWAHAKVCHIVREERSAKPKPEAWSDDLLDPAPSPDPALRGVRWSHAFSRAESREELSELYVDAKAAGVKGLELQNLVSMGQRWLKQIGDPS
jgi:hypothetical protein